MTLADKYERDNRKAAEIILGDPQKYEGLPVEWAQLWILRHGRDKAKRDVNRRSAPGQARQQTSQEAMQ